jgi:hypothetical protein
LLLRFQKQTSSLNRAYQALSQGFAGMSNQDQTDPTTDKILPACSHKETVISLLAHHWFGNQVTAAHWWDSLWSVTSKE